MTPVLQLCARREHMMTKAQFFLLISEALLQFNSRIVTTHLASVMTLNNREMITGHEVTFSDDVLTVVKVAFAHFAFELPCPNEASNFNKTNESLTNMR